MAATRKLQGEIDRCLKKVAEGVETFEDIWKKVHNATNSNQKEKYEADLKKEIKKLQRLRDQIKSWIASAEIKDKSSLLENRRLIETQMERFKIVERETKTKAYSKEGLGAAQKMDPAQRIKDEARNWLTNSISSLQLQIDQYESEIESLLAGKKKRLDRDKQDRMDELRSKLDRHKFHITKLETLLRLLDNDGVEAEQVNKIKDDVEYYIDSSQEPDFEENEFIYDDIIGLDEVELSGVSLGIPSSATTDSNNSNETSGSPSSITSGVSPATSPQPMQQQHHVINSQQQQQLQHQQQIQAQQGTLQNTTLNTSGNMAINYSQDSLNMDGSGNGLTIMPNADKRKIDAVMMNNKQPVKPTPVRAVINNKTPTSTTIEAPLNKIINTTPSKLHYQQQQQQQQQQQHQQLTSTVNQQQAINTALVSSLPSAQQQAHQQQQQQIQQAQGTQMTNMNVLSTGTSVSNPSIHGQSVIQATPTIAFAAVAKNSTSHLENGGPVTTANNFIGITGNSSIAQQHPQQQQTHLPNLPTHLQNGLSDAINSIQNNAVDSISLKTMAQEAINRTSIMNAVNLTQQQPHDTRQQQQQQQAQLQSNVHYTTNTDKTSTNINNQLQQQQQQQQQTQQQQQLQQQQNSTAISGASVGGSVEITQNGATTTTTTTNLQAAGNLLNATNTNSHSQQQQQQQQQSASSLSNNSNPTVNTSTPTSTTGNLLVGRQLQNPTNEAHIPPLLGVAPLGPHPLGKDNQFQFQMMESAFYHLPQPIDSEKMTTYFHRTPVQTPSYYPQSPLPIYDTVEFYQRLSTETLFFVFYYMEGSKAQYLAAKALKKQSWRFHTKYMMWFQRHEEPKIINDDYEQGTYIYFDYEKWSQRKKEGFTFEYKYLEDKDLN